MKKAQQAASKPIIVLFFHSGCEYRVGRRTSGTDDGSVPWVPVRNAHTKRLIVHPGDYIDENKRVQRAQLAFWGEWEAPTKAHAILPVPNDELGIFARWAHILQSPLKATDRHGKNTDPCVFGSSFKYCCCLQNRKYKERIIPTRMQSLAPGSLILFGSKTSCQLSIDSNSAIGGTVALPDKRVPVFALDTVFVVSGEKRISYKTRGTFNELDVPEVYKELTLKRLLRREENTFYRGQVFSGTDKMYSFTPARFFCPGQPSYGKRFVLTSKQLQEILPISENECVRVLHKTQGMKYIAPEDLDVSKVWLKLVALVRDEGFVPGVAFDWPK